MPTAINGRIIQGIAINGQVIKGMAIEGNVVFKDTLPLIFGEIDVPAEVSRSTTTTFKVRVNRNAGYLVAYRVDTGAGVSRTVKSVTDLPDGTREIAFTMSFGTRGDTSIRLVPAVSSTNNRNDNSELIINFRVV